MLSQIKMALFHKKLEQQKKPNPPAEFQIHRPKPQPKSDFEQMKALIERAEQFDALQRTTGWEEILRHMGAEVQNTLIEATNLKHDREHRLMLCDMWDAKRELLDSVQAYIDSTQKERDRIIREYKGELADGDTSYTGD